MVPVRLLVVSIISLMLLLTKISASKHRYIRQTGTDECLNPTSNNFETKDFHYNRLLLRF
jgi:hypothetical protein